MTEFVISGPTWVAASMDEPLIAAGRTRRDVVVELRRRAETVQLHRIAPGVYRVWVGASTVYVSNNPTWLAHNGFIDASRAAETREISKLSNLT